MRNAEPAGREAQVLVLWERGVGLDRWRRDDALLSAYAPPPSRLGARNKGLLGIRNRHFNRAWPLKSSCPQCAMECEFEADSLHLLTVHHKDGNHEHNPADGSNWENLCVYCHEDEHSRGLLGDYLTGKDR